MASLDWGIELRPFSPPTCPNLRKTQCLVLYLKSLASILVRVLKIASTMHANALISRPHAVGVVVGRSLGPTPAPSDTLSCLRQMVVNSHVVRMDPDVFLASKICVECGALVCLFTCCHKRHHRNEIII